MSSHLRYVLAAHGGHYAGHNVFRILRQDGEDSKGCAATIAAAKKLGYKLWVFREPRATKYARSRYKKICRAMGMNHKRKPVSAAYMVAMQQAQATMLGQPQGVPDITTPTGPGNTWIVVPPGGHHGINQPVRSPRDRRINMLRG